MVLIKIGAMMRWYLLVMMAARVYGGRHLDNKCGKVDAAEEERETGMVQPAGTHNFLIIVLGPSSVDLVI